MSHDNRSLLRKIVSLQDDERQDIARELHDELGPLLFGIRANTVALMESMPPGSAGLEPSAQGILQSVEALQYANRRILDRLRPLYIQELGLERMARDVRMLSIPDGTPEILTLIQGREITGFDAFRGQRQK